MSLVENIKKIIQTLSKPADLENAAHVRFKYKIN